MAMTMVMCVDFAQMKLIFSIKSKPLEIAIANDRCQSYKSQQIALVFNQIVRHFISERNKQLSEQCNCLLKL